MPVDTLHPPPPAVLHHLALLAGAVLLVGGDVGLGIRRIVGFGMQAVAVDGPALCRMFNQE